jgi:peptidoglycan/LPS O-acetylase OafA/YrhL
MNRWRWPRRSLVSVLSLLGIAVVIANGIVGHRFYPAYRMLVPSVLATLSVAALLIFGTWESVRRRIRNRRRLKSAREGR